jgi:hypothetical protein
MLSPFSMYVTLSRCRGRDTIWLLRDFDYKLKISFKTICPKCWREKWRGLRDWMILRGKNEIDNGCNNRLSWQMTIIGVHRYLLYLLNVCWGWEVQIYVTPNKSALRIGPGVDWTFCSAAWNLIAYDGCDAKANVFLHYHLLCCVRFDCILQLLLLPSEICWIYQRYSYFFTSFCTSANMGRLVQAQRLSRSVERIEIALRGPLMGGARA